MAITSMGTKLKKGTTVIAGLNSIAGLELSAESIDVTALDNIGGYKSFIGGQKDGGEVKVKGFLDGTAHESIYADFEDGSIDAYTIEFPDVVATTGSQWAFSAVVIGFSTGAEVGNAVSFEATFKVSGKPTFTKGS
jgi:predicted secreted protein